MKYRFYDKTEGQKMLDLELFETVGNGWKYPGCPISKPDMGKLQGLVKLGATVDHHAPIVTTGGIRDLNSIIMARVSKYHISNSAVKFLFDGFSSGQIWGSFFGSIFVSNF